ncbi:MAG: MFS transporter [Candidatus Buchananbacteria bacterium]
MHGKIEGIVSSFIPSHMRRQVRELFASTIILNFAMAMVTIFEPIFLFLFFSEKFNITTSLSYVLIFYLAVYIPYLFCVSFGAGFAKKFGYEYGITLGTIFAALFYFALFAMNTSVWFILPAVIIDILWKIFYWPAYHANFAKFSVDGEQGREIGNMVVFEALVYVIGPIIGGLVVKFMGFKALFILSAIIMILSNVPMLLTKEKEISGTFSYKDAFKRLFAKKNLKRTISILGYGEELIVLVIWPIFMFVVVKDFLELGVITAIATFITTAMFLYIGKLADKSNPNYVLRFGAVLYFFGWIFRIFAKGIWGVFAIDTYSRITKQSVAVPMLAQIYKKARHTSVMEGVVYFEMALVVGKIIAIVLSLILIMIFGASWNAIFILGGLMSLLYIFFKI